MKAYRNNLGSLSKIDSELNNKKQDKIQVVNCPLKELKCKDYLSVINKNYKQSELFRIDKDYQRSIEALKSAFYKITDFNELSCLNCAELFRSTIMDSIKNIHSELEKITTGFLSKKHYQQSYIFASQILKELEDHDINKTYQLKKANGRFSQNFPAKNVI